MARWQLALLAALAVGLPATSCSSEPSERCQQICKREADCADDLANDGYKIDANDCAQVCTALERDKESRKAIDAHIECARRATSCEALAECNDPTM